MNKRLELVDDRTLVLTEKPIPDAPRRGMVVKVHYAGVCHSDVHCYENRVVINEDQVLRETDVDEYIYPVVLGHEISGVVHSLGSEVGRTAITHGIRVGDRVMVYPWGGCRRCGQCKSGKTSRCLRTFENAMGFCVEGGYQQYITVSETGLVVVVPPELPLDKACLLPCGGLTAYNAVKAALPTVQEFLESTGQANLLIVGAGGLGLWTIDIAKALMPPETNIVVAEVSQSKLEQAKKAGAYKTILWDVNATSEANARKTLSVIPKKVHAAIDLVNSKETAGAIHGSLQRFSMWVMVGLHGGTFHLPLPLVPINGITIKGICYGDMDQLRHLTELVAAETVKPPFFQHVTLEEVESVLLQLKQRTYHGRAVIKHVEE